LSIDRKCTLEDGSTAELTIHEDCAQRIVNFDGTNHPLSTQGDCGGSRTNMYSDPNLPSGSSRGIRDARHTLGTYSSTAAGETIPQVYIFDHSARNTDKFKVKDSWVNNLPKVRGRYGCPTTEEYPSSVSVRASGCTDEDLFQQLISEIYLPLFLNSSQQCEWNEDNKLMKGAIIIKTDSGQDRLAAMMNSVEFQE